MNRKTILTAALVAAICAAPVVGAQGGLRYTISVTQFENQAGWYGQWDIGNAWGTVLTDLLNDTGRFIVLGESDMRGAALDEQDFAASGRTAQGAKTPVTGQMTPAQILVKGAITHVQHDVKSGGGGVRIKGFKIGGKGGKSEVNITMYMVDSTTGQILASTSVVGEAGRKGAAIGYSSYDWGAAFGGEKNDNLGQAIADAAAQGVEFMVSQLEDIPWRGSVALVKDGKVYINRGTREGVSSGQTFVVGTVDVIRDPDTGEVLDESVNEVARLQADTVKEKLAICSVVSGNAGAVEAGMGVYPR
ncbi:MAG: CsgG/HfaB family protein [Thermoanaerobaculia bacterium]|nr:CsgG/HfaB family protein [Thermoanaerobaculia bacterium]